MQAPPSIVCVDCGGTCHLLVNLEQEFQPGDNVPYRCVDCWDRWDIVLAETEGDGA